MFKNWNVLKGMWFFTGLMIGLVIVGGVRFYSDVPVMDMWDGVVSFVLKSQRGMYSAWWEQHNEHRILMSRLLFWADLNWFGGHSIFLLVINYILAFSMPLVIWRILRERRKFLAKPWDESAKILVLFLGSWLVLWCQKDNLIWPFQNQFFLSQLLPLLSFWTACKSSRGERKVFYFLISCLLGFGSAWTMANGIIVLPLLTVMSALRHQGLTRLVINFVLTVATLILYFFNYESPSHHSSLVNSLWSHPVEVLNYTFCYLGSPFYFLVGKGPFGVAIAWVMGGVFTLLVLKKLMNEVFNKSNHPLDLMLVLYLIYILGTAAGTAGGRVHFGVQQAMSERYTTPALIAWSIICILFEDRLGTLLLPPKKTSVKVGCGLLLLLMLIKQLGVFSKNQAELNRKKLAALALELQVRDSEVIQSIFPFTSRALMIAKEASDKKISIFGYKPLKDLRAKLGSVSGVADPFSQCEIERATYKNLPDDLKWVRIEGSLSKSMIRTPPDLFSFTNEKKQIIGYAIEDPSTTRLKGYILVLSLGDPIYVMGRSSSCYNSLHLEKENKLADLKNIF